MPPGLCPAIVDGRYKISETLFRLIAGDQCDDSALPDIVPDTDGKGDSVHHNKHGGSGALAAAGKLFGIFIAVVAAFAAVALAVVAVMRVGPSRLTQSLSSAAGAVGSAVSGIGSRFVGPPRTPDYYTSGLDPLGDDFAGAAAGPYAPISSAPYRGSAPPALGTPSVAVGPPGGAWGASAPSGYAPPPLGVSGEGEGAGTGGGSAFGGQGGGGGHPLGDGTPLIERGSGGGTNGARDGEA